jgi:hypothetical protein
MRAAIAEGFKLTEAFPPALFHGWHSTRHTPREIYYEYNPNHNPEPDAYVMINFWPAGDKPGGQDTLTVNANWKLGWGNTSDKVGSLYRGYYWFHGEHGKKYYGDQIEKAVPAVHSFIQHLVSLSTKEAALEKASKEATSHWETKEIRLHTGQGPKAVKAQCLGTLAVHPSLDSSHFEEGHKPVYLYDITHAPTGLKMGGDIKSEGAAQAVVEELLKEFPLLATAKSKEDAKKAILNSVGGHAQFARIVKRGK